MSVAPEEGLRLMGSDEVDDVDLDAEATRDPLDGPAADLETLRDEFVDAFNARDMEALLGLVHDDIECPDIRGDGVDALAEEISAIWERSPTALLTRAFLDDVPCAVAWLPDEDACWSRAALVTFDHEQGLLSVVSLPDDADALDRAEAETPDDDDHEEGADWVEWDSGGENDPKPRNRARP